MITLYHGSDYLFNKFLFKNVGKKSGTGGAGFGLYFTDSKADALAYGKYVYTVNADLKNGLSNERITLSRNVVKLILSEFEKISENSFIENIKENASIDDGVIHLMKYNRSDIDLINDIINSTNGALEMMQVLTKLGYTHGIDKKTPEDRTITNYVVFDLNCLKIIKREKPLGNLTESFIQKYIDLNESETIIVNENIPQPLVSLTDNMQRQAKTRTLSQAQGRAKSKSQRRLMAMALAYKRGKLPDKYVSDTIKKLSKSIDQQTLHDFAKTNQKKRRKDGSIGKRNNIPYKVKK